MLCSKLEFTFGYVNLARFSQQKIFLSHVCHTKRRKVAAEAPVTPFTSLTEDLIASTAGRETPLGNVS